MSPEKRGTPPARLGNITYTQEEVASIWGFAPVGILIQDLRHALRTLRKSPGFAATAILTLSLGIGREHRRLTVVDSVILKPLAFHDSGRLVAAWERVRFLGGYPVGPNPRHRGYLQETRHSLQRSDLPAPHANGLTLDAEHPRLTCAVACLPNLFEIFRCSQSLAARSFPKMA